MLIARTAGLVAGTILVASMIGATGGLAAEIPETILDRDYDACVAEAAVGQEEFQEYYCQCVVGRMKDGMDLGEYIVFASGLDYETMSDEEIVIKTMANEKINAWIQECVEETSRYIK